MASAAGANALVDDAKAAGATPIISFGGAAGKELSLSCTNATSLVDAYSAVINRFGVRKIDFDIEGSAITNAASIARRFTAIKALERRFQGLEVSLTVPVGPGGLDSSGVALLKKAKSAGVRVDVVNIMAMDYGDARDMGAAAMSAASGTLAQLKKIWPADTYSHIGITPMIGQNDTPSEQFTYDNATSVVSFARSHGVRRLAFWSLNRDQQCASGEPLSDCSGMAQDPLDYTDAFTG